MAVRSILRLYVVTISVCLPTIRSLLQFLGHIFISYSSSLTGSGKRSGTLDSSKKSYASEIMPYSLARVRSACFARSNVIIESWDTWAKCPNHKSPIEYRFAIIGIRLYGSIPINALDNKEDTKEGSVIVVEVKTTRLCRSGPTDIVRASTMTVSNAAQKIALCDSCQSFKISQLFHLSEVPKRLAGDNRCPDTSAELYPTYTPSK